MERMDIDYLALEREAIAFINSNFIWVLATAVGNQVTARTVFTVSNGVVIFFQTDKNSTKYRQLAANPNVALCRDHVQIEGKAREIGSPLDSKNLPLSHLFQQHHPLAYKRYSGNKTEALFEVHPTQVTLWKHNDRQTYRDILQIIAKKAYRVLDVAHAV